MTTEFEMKLSLSWLAQININIYIETGKQNTETRINQVVVEIFTTPNLLPQLLGRLDLRLTDCHFESPSLVLCRSQIGRDRKFFKRSYRLTETDEERIVHLS